MDHQKDKNSVAYWRSSNANMARCSVNLVFAAYIGFAFQVTHRSAVGIQS
jgi:hypothetical protein